MYLGEVLSKTLACGADDQSLLPIGPIKLTSPSFVRRQQLLLN